MKLTGKCKIDFEKWFINKSLKWFDDIPDISDDKKLMECCGKLVKFIGYGASGMTFGKSMQYGVYVDWFDSVGRAKFILHKFIKHYSEHRNIDEARDYSIEKENEIYNSK